MDTGRKDGRAAAAGPVALLETYAVACGYVPWEKPSTAGGEAPANLGILDDLLRIALVLASVAGTFALSLYALSVVLRW